MTTKGKVFAAVIGGSGFYDLLQDSQDLEVSTPFGTVTIHVGMHGDIPLAFLPRHGVTHAVPPHRINYRANMWALHHLDAQWMIGTNAVGAVNPNLELGSIVLVNDFIDLWDEPLTYFDGKSSFSVKVRGKERSGVVHVDMTDPYCRKIRKHVLEAARSQEIPFTIISEGVYANTKGPRFETPAEIRALRVLGADVVGMTGAREATLARELGRCYASLCIVTNKAAGMQEQITTREVFELFNMMVPDVKRLILATIESLWEKKETPCDFDS